MSELDHQDRQDAETAQQFWDDEHSEAGARGVRRLDHLSIQELEAQLMGAPTHAGDKARDEHESLGEAIAKYQPDVDPHAQWQQPAKVTRAVSRRRRSAYYSAAIDLHHMSVAQALKILEAEIEALLSRHRRVKLKVITGRGRHSSQGPQIAHHAYALVVTKFKSAILKIGECPTASMINNVALKGFFDVELQGYRH